MLCLSEDRVFLCVCGCVGGGIATILLAITRSGESSAVVWTSVLQTSSEGIQEEFRHKCVKIVEMQIWSLLGSALYLVSVQISFLP